MHVVNTYLASQHLQLHLCQATTPWAIMDTDSALASGVFKPTFLQVSIPLTCMIMFLFVLTETWK